MEIFTNNAIDYNLLLDGWMDGFLFAKFHRINGRMERRGGREKVRSNPSNASSINFRKRTNEKEALERRFN